MTGISLRTAFGRIGGEESEGDLRTGALPKTQQIYRANEFISLKETFDRHAPQDGNKSSTDSVARWIETHCDPDSGETVIPTDTSLLDTIVGKVTGWGPVEDERTRFLAGFQEYSRVTYTDNPVRHETRDWNWDIRPSPQFTYMLADNNVFKKGSPQQPFTHNEWESGSMPLEWRPFWGEYVTIYGRHIFDVAHEPFKTEIHPAHSIVREHTTASPIGDNDVFVPVNRAIVGMGLSGGFPGKIDQRWDDEFGGVPDGVGGDTTDCWPTDLAGHPLRFKLFPPVPRPSLTAELRRRVVLCEVIKVDDWHLGNHFLQVCEKDDPSSGGINLGFRRWSREEQLPVGFVPQEASSDLMPRFTEQEEGYYDVDVDLSPVRPSIALGYYAIVECGWSERGPHDIYQLDVTFDQLETTSDTFDFLPDEWHLYYGVNGQWKALWVDDSAVEDKTSEINQTFRVHTVDDMPLLIRDCGVEWDGFDYWNNTIDRVEFDAPGPDPLLQLPGEGNPRQFALDANEVDSTSYGGATHRWRFEVERREV